MSVLGVIDLTKATEVRPTVLKEAPTETKHGFEIVTPTRVWKICPDVEDPAEAEFAVERWVSLLAASEAYAKVQLRGMNYTRTSNDGGTGDGTEGGTENTAGGTGETKGTRGTRGTREVNGEQNAPNTRLTLHQVKVEGSPGSPALDSPSGRRALLVRSVRRVSAYLPPSTILMFDISRLLSLLSLLPLLPSKQHHADSTGQVMVTETSSWARMTGNVRIGVLSESPWSAMEIAKSLVAAGDTDVNTVRMEDNKMHTAHPPPPPTNQAGNVSEVGRSNNEDANDATDGATNGETNGETCETKGTVEEEPSPPTPIATASGQYRPQFQMPDKAV